MRNEHVEKKTQEYTPGTFLAAMKKLNPRDFKSGPRSTRSKGGGLIVANNLLGHRVPLDFTAEAGRNRAEVASVHCLQMAVDIGYGKAAFSN